MEMYKRKKEKKGKARIFASSVYFDGIDEKSFMLQEVGLNYDLSPFPPKKKGHFILGII